MRLFIALGLLATAGCAAAGTRISPQPGDFAFLDLAIRT